MKFKRRLCSDDAVSRKCSVKKVYLEVSSGKHLCQSLFFNKEIYYKRDSGTGAFLEILRNF